MKVYGDKRSGNCYKIGLLLKLLGRSYEWVDIDILKGETHTPEFLCKNPNGKIPLIELDDRRCLSESNAILGYLADGTDLVPQDPFEKAQLYSWLFFEQYSHEPKIAVARFIKLYQDMPEDRVAEYETCLEKGYKALGIMESQLLHTRWLVGESMTIADVALYAYTHVAHEGGFNLRDFEGIRTWIERIQALPDYASMEEI